MKTQMGEEKKPKRLSGFERCAGFEIWDSSVSSSSSSLSPSIISSSDLARQLRPQKEQAGHNRRRELDLLFQILTDVFINLKA